MSGSIPRIRPGFIVFGTENGGYVRKVISTAVDGKRLFVRTEPAYLTDAIIRGRIDTTLTLGFGSSASAGRTPQQGASDFELAQAIPGVSVSENGLRSIGGDSLFGQRGRRRCIRHDRAGTYRVRIPSWTCSRRSGSTRLTGFHAIAEGMLNLDCDVEIERYRAPSISRGRYLSLR